VQLIEREQKAEITAKVIDNNVEISVTDTGIGVNATDIPKLFGQFVRLQSPLTLRTSVLNNLMLMNSWTFVFPIWKGLRLNETKNGQMRRSINKENLLDDKSQLANSFLLIS